MKHIAAVTMICLAVACGGSKGSTTQPSSTTTTPSASLAAKFTVVSLSAAQRKTSSDATPVTVLAAGAADACPLVNNGGNPIMDCQFDGATSTGSISKYIWTYAFGTQQKIEETTTPQLKPFRTGCGLFGGQSGSSAGGLQFIGMKVDLQVQDGLGNKSTLVSNQNVRIFPAGLCGYGF
jgi:hypothetical protein